MAEQERTREQKAIKDIVSDAVTRGYKVIEDQILQGREAAERVRAGTYNSANAEEDMKKLIDRMMDLLKELGTTSFDLAAAVIRDPRVTGARKADITVETRSARPVQVRHSFTPGSARFSPTVPALYSTDVKAPPLRKIRFEVRDGGPVLVIDIPDDQPIGTYSGAIVDLDTHQAGGYVSVSILR